jgi:hypothetical protein
MSLEQELEATIAAAGRHALGDEQPVAVIATELAAGTRVYVIAFASGGDLAYIALDEAGAPVSDRRLVRDAVSLAALAERAEEVSGATAADELMARFTDAAERLRPSRNEELAAAAAAADAVIAAAGRLADAATGPRPATAQYLDRMAALAAELAAALDAFVPHALGIPEASVGSASEVPSPRAVVEAALAVASRAGDPANFASAMTAASGAVDALVSDVIDHYRGELDDR